jgi:uncharacterized protein YybS (DUF2232 family)
LVESALLAALGAVMMLIAWYVPVIGTAVALVSPLPAAVVVIRHGTRWGVLSSVVTMLVLAPIVGWVTALGLWMFHGAMGISFGFAVRRSYRPTAVLVTAAGGCLVAILAASLTAYFVLGLSLTKQIDETITMWTQALEIDRKILGPNPVIDQLAKMLPTRETYLVMLPGVVLVAAFVMAYVNLEVFRRILPRLGHSLEALPPFSRWIFPEAVALAGILPLLASALEPLRAVPALVRVLDNVSMVTWSCFVVEALAVATFFLLRAGFSRPLAGLFIVIAVPMVLTAPELNLLVMFFGMIDILFDFRHVRFEPVGEI